MATFDWKVEEVSGEELPVEFGGEVELGNRVVKGKLGWQVEMPDSSKDLPVQKSGVVEVKPMPSSAIVAQSENRRSIGTFFATEGGLKQVIIMVAVLFLGIAFLSVVFTLLYRDKLDFDKFIYVLLAILGLIVNGYKSNKSKDGSKAK